jgi:CubicO group peptidase (beta-lactamase class C family)
VSAFDQIANWGVPHVAVALADASGVAAVDGRPACAGDLDRRFRLASVAKLFVAYAALIAVEEGSIQLDEPAGPPGATVRHLLSHTAGYGFTGPELVAPVGRRRIYSNTGIEVFAEHLAARTGIPFGEYLAEAVLAPLGMVNSELRGSPAHGLRSTVNDLVLFVRELLSPALVAASTLAEAVRVQFPGLPGVLPGVGRLDELDWGLGFERNFAKPGHWSGSRFSPASFGHFGGAGTFLAVDPVLGVGLICLGDREFDEWALSAWPPFCDELLGAVIAGAVHR